MDDPVKKHVIDRLNLLFGPPRRVPAERLADFIAEYHASLAKYSEDVLVNAMDWLRDNHKISAWPTPGEINAACRRFLPKSPPPNSRAWDALAEKWEPPNPEQRRRVQALLASLKRNLTAQGKIKQPPSHRIDTSRPTMEANEKRWRESERQYHSGRGGHDR